MLKLRRGVVVSAEPLEVDIEGARRPAWADPALVGPCEEGDEVVVNTAALDLELGSGGFDIVHVNLTRGLEAGEAPEGVHVMKLNYTSLQHPVDPVEAPAEVELRPARQMPVLVVPLHGHLAPAAWAAAAARPGARIGFVQTAGAALPATLSRDVAALRERRILIETVSAAPAYGGDHEAISVTGALHAAAVRLGWDLAIAGPGPGILGSATRLGHGGLAALDTLHAALSLRLPAVFSPRMSIGDPRPRHQGLSHHSRSVLDLVLAGVRVAAPAEIEPGGSPGDPAGAVGEGLAELTEACSERHELCAVEVDLAGYGAAQLSRRTMGRDLEEDPLFFAAPLAAGTVAAELIATT